jgi:hypothetical protein
MSGGEAGAGASDAQLLREAEKTLAQLSASKRREIAVLRADLGELQRELAAIKTAKFAQELALDEAQAELRELRVKLAEERETRRALEIGLLARNQVTVDGLEEILSQFAPEELVASDAHESASGAAGATAPSRVAPLHAAPVSQASSAARAAAQATATAAQVETANASAALATLAPAAAAMAAAAMAAAATTAAATASSAATTSAAAAASSATAAATTTTTPSAGQDAAPEHVSSAVLHVRARRGSAVELLMRLEAHLASLQVNNTASPRKKKVVMVAPEITRRAPHGEDSARGAGKHLRLILNQEATATASAAIAEHEPAGHRGGPKDSFALHEERMRRNWQADAPPPHGQNLATLRFKEPVQELGPGPLALYQPKAPPPSKPGRRAVDSIAHRNRTAAAPRATPHGGS